jgi:hypothetical protein
MGGDNCGLADVVKFIEEVLSLRRGVPAFAVVRLIDQLLLTRAGDPAFYAAYSEEMAVAAELAKRWNLARAFWQLAARWHDRGKNPGALNEAMRRAAETYVGDADDALSRPSGAHLTCGHFLGQAIEALRQIAGSKARQDELHHRMLQCQKVGVTELLTIQSEPLDLRRAIEESEAKVRGKPFNEAVLVLASEVSFPNVGSLRAHAEEVGRASLAFQLFSGTYVNASGRVIDKHPPAGSKSESDAEAWNLADMFKSGRLYRDIHVQGIIEPMRQVIWREHDVRLRDLLPLTINTIFVPPGREYLFANGLLAGFAGEWDVAAHLLVPQIENSLRYTLEQNGVITSGFDKDGIQDEFDLNKMLTAHRQHIERIFGVDRAFDLRGLLVERTGDNLRNDIAHGLVDTSGFFSTKGKYLWWLALHLCVLGWMLAKGTHTGTESGSQAEVV